MLRDYFILDQQLQISRSYAPVLAPKASLVPNGETENKALHFPSQLPTIFLFGAGVQLPARNRKDLSRKPGQRKEGREAGDLRGYADGVSRVHR